MVVATGDSWVSGGDGLQANLSLRGRESSAVSVWEVPRPAHGLWFLVALAVGWL